MVIVFEVQFWNAFLLDNLLSFDDSVFDSIDDIGIIDEEVLVQGEQPHIGSGDHTELKLPVE